MKHQFTPEQKEFVKENIKGKKSADLLKMFNDHFGTDIKINQLRAFIKNNKFTSGVNTAFKPGHVPVNKGTKGLFNVGGNRTSFKKGQKSHNYKPIGYERIDVDGYVLVKVQDHGPWHKQWRHKHKVVWEKENGPVPKGYCLLFGDGNKQNISLDNLILVSRQQLVELNRHNLIQNDIELTKTGILIADLHSKVYERKKSTKEK